MPGGHAGPVKSAVEDADQRERAMKTIRALEQFLDAIHVTRTQPALERRHRTVRHEIAARGLDALLVTSLPNILYLTNFTGSSATVVVTAARLFFITDFRYTTTISATRGTASECPASSWWRSTDRTTRRAELLKSCGRRIGFEAAHLTSPASTG